MIWARQIVTNKQNKRKIRELDYGPNPAISEIQVCLFLVSSAICVFNFNYVSVDRYLTYISQLFK